jgi:Transketolase, thiamine diphosphate binding domain
VLYDEVLDIAAERVDDPARDRFFLSKGHGPRPYYAVLAAKGFIPLDWLPTFGGFDSPLGYHPDRNLVPGVEISSGSLGHGLPLAVGAAMACALKASGRGSWYWSGTRSSTREATPKRSSSPRPRVYPPSPSWRSTTRRPPGPGAADWRLGSK